MLLVDGSDAMLAPQVEGRPRWDVARDAVAATAAVLPDGAPVGLRLAGPDLAVAPPGCADTRPLVPVTPLDRGAVASVLGPVGALGPTSTAEGLRAAVDDLPANADTTVLLVVARLGGCVPGETCAAARELVDRGVAFQVDAVGVGPDPATVDELRCVAEATGGTVRVAETAADVTAAVSRAALRAVSPLSIGTVAPVARGGPDPVVLPPGAHTETLRPGETRRYLVELADSDELLAAVSAAAPPEVADRLVLRVVAGEPPVPQADGAPRHDVAVLLGETRQSLRVRARLPEAAAGAPQPTVGAPVAAESAVQEASATETVPLVVSLEQFGMGALPPVDVPLLLDVDVVGTLLVVEAPEPVSQAAVPLPPPRLVVQEEVPTWVWGLVGGLGVLVVVLGGAAAVAVGREAD